MIRFFVLGLMAGAVIGFSIAALLSIQDQNIVDEIRPVLARLLRMINYDILLTYDTEINTDEDVAYNRGVRDCQTIVEQYLDDIEGGELIDL